MSKYKEGSEKQEKALNRLRFIENTKFFECNEMTDCIDKIEEFIYEESGNTIDYSLIKSIKTINDYILKQEKKYNQEYMKLEGDLND